MKSNSSSYKCKSTNSKTNVSRTHHSLTTSSTKVNEAILPVPPSVNHYLRRTRWGVTLTQDAKDFKDYVRFNIPPNILTGDIVMQIGYYRKRRAGDIDGILKMTMDSLQGIWYENDKQICELHVFRYDDKEYPRLEVKCYKA